MLEAHQLVYVVLEVVIACLAVAGNTLVCWSVSVNSNLQNITNFFVVSLAVADIAVGLLAIPFAISISFGFCANFYGCLFIACFVLILTQSSIFSLLAIAVDRYIAINNPLRYNSLVTGQRAKAFITLCWVLSVIIGLTPMMGWHQGSNSTSIETGNNLPKCPEGKTHCLFERVVTMNYMIYFNFFGCVILPLVAMLGIYSHIFFAARRQLRLMSVKVSQAPAPGEKTLSSGSCRSTLQKEVHAAKSLAIIVGLFAFCWLPVHILNSVNYLCGNCKRPHTWVMNVAIILSHANSVVNPFIYAYRIREFRQTFRKILYQHILRKLDGQRHSGGGGCADGTTGSCSVMRTSSRVSIEGSSCGTVVNSYVLDSSLDVTTSQENQELCSQWASKLDAVPRGYLPNGHPLKTAQQPCIVGLSPHCAEESAADVSNVKGSGSCLGFVNVQAFSLHQTNCSSATVLPEIS